MSSIPFFDPATNIMSNFLRQTNLVPNFEKVNLEIRVEKRIGKKKLSLKVYTMWQLLTGEVKFVVCV